MVPCSYLLLVVLLLVLVLVEELVGRAEVGPGLELIAPFLSLPSRRTQRLPVPRLCWPLHSDRDRCSRSLVGVAIL
jgi:hypothetical protein